MTTLVRKRLLITVGIILGISLASWLVRWTSQTRKPRLAISFSHFETHSNTTYAVIKVTNVGTGTASCYGYGLETPFYYIVTPAGTNWSWDYSPGFDWDVARPFQLPSGSSMSVRTGVPIPETWMIGIPYGESTAEQKLPSKVWLLLQRFSPLKESRSVAWSKPLTRETKPSNTVSPLGVQNQKEVLH